MLSEIGLGLSAVSAIGGLLGASSAQKAAEERRRQIISQLQAENSREYLDVSSGNAYSLGARSGELNDALVSSGRSLGAANAAAGVTNSSAVAGSLGLGEQSITKALSDYALRNKFQEQQLLDAQQQRLTGVEMGVANSDVGYQRDQTAGYIDAFGNLLSGIGGLGRAPGSAPAGIATGAPGFDPNNPMTMATVPTSPEQYGGLAQPLGMGMNVGGRAVNPLQSYMQTQTQQNRKRLGALDLRTFGDMTNGNQGSRLPALGY